MIEDASPGFWLVRGAAGSGKTSTALLRLEFLVRFWKDVAEQRGRRSPIRVLVLTFNRTLKGYVESLAAAAIGDEFGVDLTISTFAKWAVSAVGGEIVDSNEREAKISALASNAKIAWPMEFLMDEVDYVLGRFPPSSVSDYLTAERRGRGQAPRVDRDTRQRLLEQVIAPYQAWKREGNKIDWQDLAIQMAGCEGVEPYDVVIVDEAQDFSANELRAVRAHLADEHSTTFIRDTVQRIYPRHFTWQEVGIQIPAAQNKRLERNHRNTKQIAAFARPLVDGIEESEDAALPDFEGCVLEGPRPVVVRGNYSDQLDWAIDYLRSGAVGGGESVAFVYPVGGGVQNALRNRLRKERLPFVELTRQSDWPEGDEQIALCTMYSAKGLEFDHVIALGYNAQFVKHGPEAADARLENHRRLLAMTIGRARRSVALGYKPEDSSAILELLDDDTYEVVDR